MQQFSPFLKTLAQDAGALIKKHAGTRNSFQHKKVNDLVTKIDKKVELFITKTIKKNFPDHAIYAEETGKNDKKSDYRWIIDPIDGTTNFVHQMPFFAVSIALEYKDKIILGAVYNPMLDEMFFAERGKGATLNGKKIHVSKVKKLADSLLATGFHPQYRDHNMQFFETFTQKTHGIRRLGAASIDLCYTACGILDGFWEFGLEAWDIAAGALILQEAGGQATNTDGTPLTYDQKAILATNKHLHPEMLAILKSPM
jgi:myo-inositol-1(or 4)-monophosphatase